MTRLPPSERCWNYAVLANVIRWNLATLSEFQQGEKPRQHTTPRSSNLSEKLTVAHSVKKSTLLSLQPNFHLRVHRSLILSQMKPVYTPTTVFLGTF